MRMFGVCVIAAVAVTSFSPPALAQGDAAKGIPSLAGQPPGYLREQIRLFKQDARSPGDAALTAAKALMKTVPESQEADLAAYYSSLR